MTADKLRATSLEDLAGALLLEHCRDEPAKYAAVIPWVELRRRDEAVAKLVDAARDALALLSLESGDGSITCDLRAALSAFPEPSDGARRQKIANLTPTDDDFAPAPSPPPEAWYREQW